MSIKPRAQPSKLLTFAIPKQLCVLASQVSLIDFLVECGKGGLLSGRQR